MAKYLRTRFRLWTGPCGVAEVAGRLRSFGMADVVEGTEHVYATAWWSPERMHSVRQVVETAIGYGTALHHVEVYLQEPVTVLP